jgi:hypothetical protein
MMPAEEPNKADELLRRYAKKRREQGGDFALHPATRRLLQGEITRQRGSRQNDGQRNLFTWLSVWRNRLVLRAAATAVLVALTTWMLREHSPGTRTVQLAKVEDNISPGAAGLPKEMLAEVERRTERAGATPRDLADLDTAQEKLVVLNGATPAAAPTEDSTLRKNSSIGFAITGSNTSTVAGDVPAAAARASVLNYSVNLATAPPTPPAGPLFGSSPSTGVQPFGLAPTAGVMLADSYFAKDATVPPVVSVDKRAEDFKRLGEVTSLGLQLEAKQPTQEIRPAATLAAEKSSANAPVSVLSTPSQPIGQADGLSAAQTDVAAAGKAKSQAVITASGATGLGAVFYRQTEEASLPQVAQTSQRLESVQKKREADSAVLTQFTIEQSGNKLRITEPDGSVYEGTLEEGMVAKADFETNGGRNRLDTLARESVAPQRGRAQQQYQFRAIGSNVTLHQNVEVNARVTSEDGTAQAPTAQGRFGGGAGSAAPSRPAPAAPTSRARRANAQARGWFAPVTNQISAIEGTVRIGLTNEQRFKAVRAQQ